MIAEKYRAERLFEGGDHFGSVTSRIPVGKSLDASKGQRDVKISPKGMHSIAFGVTSIDLGGMEQLVHVSQTRAIGDAIWKASAYMDGVRTLREVVGIIIDEISRQRLDVLGRYPVGDYAAFRGVELAAAINRLRTLSVRQDA